MRWNAFHFTNGWSNYTEDEYNNFYENQNKGLCGKLLYACRKNKDKKRHACLVPWADLAETSSLFCYNTKCSDILKIKYPNCPKDNLNEEIQKIYPQITGFQLEDLKQTLNIPSFLDYAEIKVKKFVKETKIMVQYTPKPIDTSNIVLTDDIKQLTELLAKNTHEIWAAQRIKNGWTY
jgi:hypothetical protein